MQKMSIDDLMTELDDARLTAKENGQASAMVAATMSKAKLLGLDKGDSDKDSEVMPVKIVIQTVDARNPDRVCQFSDTLEGGIVWYIYARTNGHPTYCHAQNKSRFKNRLKRLAQPNP